MAAIHVLAVVGTEQVIAAVVDVFAVLGCIFAALLFALAGMLGLLAWDGRRRARAQQALPAPQAALCPWCDGAGLDDRGWPEPGLCDCTGPCGRSYCPALNEAVDRG